MIAETKYDVGDYVFVIEVKEEVLGNLWSPKLISKKIIKAEISYFVSLELIENKLKTTPKTTYWIQNKHNAVGIEFKESNVFATLEKAKKECKRRNQ